MKTTWIAGLLAIGFAATGGAFAHPMLGADRVVLASATKAKRPVTPPRPALAAAPRDTAPVVVSGTAPGQAGFIHYFIITGRDGEPESHVGIELPGDRIAWSFPELGVVVAPFIKAGVVNANGQPFEVEYLYGLRPPVDDESLKLLQRTLPERIAWWIDEKIPFCDEERPSNRLCVSCLGFVLRVLYPGSSPGLPSLPPDFRNTQKGMYTTEDLLLYLAGVRVDVSRDARLKRIATLDVPDPLREELVRIAGRDTAAESTAQSSRPAIAKPRSTGRSMVQTPRKAMLRHGS